MERIYFTSDLHLGHRLVAGIRGHANTDDHDQSVADAWASVVKSRDQVWVLGDLCLGNPTKALDLIKKLPGEKHMIWGNHDLGHPMHRNSHRKAGLYTDAFASAQAFARRRIYGLEVLLSHFPYVGDTAGRGEDRHVQYRLLDGGVPIIHGHTHSRARFTYAEIGWTPHTPQVHVGWDAWLAPVPLDSVAALLRVGPK